VGKLDAQGRTLKRLLAAVALAGAAATSALAHVGSPDVIFEGAAGPYPVRVTVRTPGVIPGLAEITVRLLGPTTGDVSVQPIWWRAPGEEGVPPADRAQPVRGDTGLYSGALWLMAQGSFAVRVNVAGANGNGSVLVPVVATATRTAEMDTAFAAILLVLGGLLYAGAASIAGAATREAVVPLGQEPDVSRRRRGYVATAVMVVLVSALAWGLWRWWSAEDARYRARLYRPLSVAASVRPDAGGGVLRLALLEGDVSPRRWGRIAPDHGKLMHLFLIREPGLDAIAHLHPVPVPPGSGEAFETPLPRLPAGSYRLYADVTRESGFAETLTGRVAVPARGADAVADAPVRVAERVIASGSDAVSADPDDSWHLSGALPSGEPNTTAVVDLAGGYSLRREAPVDAPRAAREITLRFRIVDGAGATITPEPYMGMAAHAVITREDGAVFIHLHPSGTISMASQMLFAARQGKTAADDPHAAHRAAEQATLSFPYEFPQPGRYRMWVQVKVAGVVRTGLFDFTVEPAIS
jgi:hypothetical protein